MVQVTVQGRAGTVLQGEHGTQPMVRFWRGQGREHHRTGAGTLRIRQPALPLGTDSGAGTRRAPGLLSFGGQPLSKPSFQQLEVVPLSSPALLSYLRQRGINTKLAKRECREVRYLTGGKPYFAVGFLNRSGGYEIRNKFFKGCIAPKDITHIRQEQPKETCYLFEGFMDYLSFLTLRLERCPDRPDLDGQDYIVLNSTSNLSKAIRPLGGYGRIHCFLDNDKAGMEAVQELREEYGLRVRDASHIYGGYNDLNDFLRDKQNGQSEHQQQKPEPEKSQQKTEQPERKGKGIRM